MTRNAWDNGDEFFFWAAILILVGIFLAGA